MSAIATPLFAAAQPETTVAAAPPVMDNHPCECEAKAARAIYWQRVLFLVDLVLRLLLIVVLILLILK